MGLLEGKARTWVDLGTGSLAGLAITSLANLVITSLANLVTSLADLANSSCIVHHLAVA